MADITVPANIPAGARPNVKAVCEQIGKQVLGDNKWPDDIVDDGDLTNAEVGRIFELVTREFWRQQIQAMKANAAAEAARLAEIQANTPDPFVE